MIRARPLLGIYFLVAALGAMMLGAVTLTPGTALAHGDLIESRPAAGSTVGGDITTFELQFVGLAYDGDHKLSVTGPDGSNVATVGQVTQEVQRLTLTTVKLSTPGQYLVNYRVDGLDGDSSAATFGFVYDPAAPAPAPLTTMQAPLNTTGGGAASANGSNPVTSVLIVALACLATLFAFAAVRRRAAR